MVHNWSLQFKLRNILSVDNYLYGGMPLAVLKGEEEKKEYLKGLFETIYFRDIVERNHLRRGEELDELCNIISASTGEILNSERISNTFRSVRKSKIDKQTVEPMKLISMHKKESGPIIFKSQQICQMKAPEKEK